MDISAKKLELIEMLLHTQKEAVLDQVGWVLKNQGEIPLNIPSLNNALRVEILNSAENTQVNAAKRDEEMQVEAKKMIIPSKGHFDSNLNKKDKK